MGLSFDIIRRLSDEVAAPYAELDTAIVSGSKLSQMALGRRYSVLQHGEHDRFQPCAIVIFRL